MSGMPLRDYRVHRYVNAFCPRCHDERPEQPLADVRRLSGWLAVEDDRVWLERGCPEHGRIRTLYDESAEILRYLEQWTAPTKQHLPDLTGNFLPVPAAYADGLPEMQTQHTCILLADVTDHCNLRCPTCFAASGPALSAVAPLDRVLASVDARLAREQDRLDVLMLSATTGTGRTLLTERDSAYVDVEGEGLRWLAGERQFLWLSDRSGWRQLYLYDRSGRLVRQITKDGADVLEVLDAQRGLFDAQLGRLQVERDYLVATVTLYRALGGSWSA